MTHIHHFCTSSPGGLIQPTFFRIPFERNITTLVPIVVPQWNTAETKIKVPSAENQEQKACEVMQLSAVNSLCVLIIPAVKGSLSPKPEVGQNIALRASPTSRNSILPS